MIVTGQDLLVEVTTRLVSEFNPEEIWLFGSPIPDSDLDLLVIVSDSKERPAGRMRRAYRCLRGLNISKDVLVQTRAEFERKQKDPASLTCKILHQGRKLYDVLVPVKKMQQASSFIGDNTGGGSLPDDFNDPTEEPNW